MKLALVLFLFTFIPMVTVTNGGRILNTLANVASNRSADRHHRHRHHHHQHHRRHRHHRRRHENALPEDAGPRLFADAGLNPVLLSPRVSFGRTAPRQPPWSVRFDADAPRSDQPNARSDPERPTDRTHGDRHFRHADGNNVIKSVDDSSSFGGDLLTLTSEGAGGAANRSAGGLSGRSRGRRALQEEHHKVEVAACESVSRWLQLQTAMTVWGQRVEVLQEFMTGGVPINQYFYETFCREEGIGCVGIDERRFESGCKTKHTWAYAHVRTRDGEVGWNIINIRGSCNCGLYRRTRNAQAELADLLEL